MGGFGGVGSVRITDFCGASFNMELQKGPQNEIPPKNVSLQVCVCVCVASAAKISLNWETTALLPKTVDLRADWVASPSCKESLLGPLGLPCFGLLLPGFELLICACCMW